MVPRCTLNIFKLKVHIEEYLGFDIFLEWPLLSDWLKYIFSHFGLIMDTLGPLYRRHPADVRQQCFTVIGKDDNGGIMTLKCFPQSGQGPSLVSCSLSGIK